VWKVTCIVDLSSSGQEKDQGVGRMSSEPHHLYWSIYIDTVLLHSKTWSLLKKKNT
jgi:hypothetical protein